MVENPVGIQSLDVALEAVELRVCIVLVQPEIFVRRNFEITACFPVVKVYSKFGAVQVIRFLFEELCSFLFLKGL